MCAYRSMPWGMHTARTWRNFQIQTQGKKFARVATACVHTGLCPGVYILRGHGATFKFKLKAKSSRGYAKHAEPVDKSPKVYTQLAREGVVLTQDSDNI